MSFILSYRPYADAVVVHLGQHGFLVAAVHVAIHNNRHADNVVGLRNNYPAVLNVYGLWHDGYRVVTVVVVVSVHHHLVTPIVQYSPVARMLVVVSIHHHPLVMPVVVHYYPPAAAVLIHRNIVVLHYSYPAHHPVQQQPVSTGLTACDA